MFSIPIFRDECKLSVWIFNPLSNEYKFTKPRHRFHALAGIFGAWAL